MGHADLHAHSVYSDGTLAPAQLVQRAAAKALCAVALTDHNTTAGLAEFMRAGAEHHLETVAGVEFSTELDGQELHLLGLFLPACTWTDIEAVLKRQNERKEQHNRDCVERLRRDGYPIDWDELLLHYPGTHHNRMHIAKLLVKAGAVGDVPQAFQTLLLHEGRYYQKPPLLSFLTMIERIGQWGGVSVWAHPLRSVLATQAERILPLAVSRGLDGLETRYHKSDRPGAEALRRAAIGHELLESGGSDFHGSNKPEIDLGLYTVTEREYRALSDRRVHGAAM